jgi:hypothetical protein
VPLIAMAAIYAYLAGYGGRADDGSGRLHGRVLRLAASVYNQKFQCSYSLSAEQRTSLYCADAAVAHTAGTVLAAHLASNGTTAAVLLFTADLYNIVPGQLFTGVGAVYSAVDADSRRPLVVWPSTTEVSNYQGLLRRWRTRGDLPQAS